ncbi:MAG: YdcF family protein [Bacilli bacterium]
MWHLIWTVSVFVIGIFLFANSIIASVVSTISIGTIVPFVVGFLMMGISVLKWTVMKETPLIANELIRNGMYVAAIVLVVGFMAIQLMIFSAKNDDLKNPDVFIVLGAALIGETPSLSLQFRLEKAVELADRYPDSVLVVSGGQGEGEDITEAEAMRRYLVDKGVDRSRVYEEAASTSTYENFQFSKVLIAEQRWNPDEIVVITNDFHMFRSKMLASRVGLTVKGQSAQTPFGVRLANHVRETFAVMKSYFMDKPEETRR